MKADNKIFEENYLKIRSIEHRIYTDQQVKELPFKSPFPSQNLEWKLRSKTTARFLSYIEKREFKNVLDIGCGNGWFTNQIAQKLTDFKVLGGDINNTELNQAKKCFNRSNLDFTYLDIFSLDPDKKFDLITINAAIQYFPDIAEVLLKIKSLLTDNGEFHILDSPVYHSERDAQKAKQRSDQYYYSMGVPEMSGAYFHHTWSDFSDFEILYRPKLVPGINKILKQSPFPWLVFRNKCYGKANQSKGKIKHG